MKLFSPREATLLQEKKVSDDLSQVALLSTTLKRIQTQINDGENEFSQRMKEQRDVYGTEKIRLQQEIRDLEERVISLREERRELMKPINLLKEEVDAQAAEAQRILIAAQEEANEAEELILQVQNKLDNLIEREVILVEAERLSSARRKGIEDEALQVSEGHKKLNAVMSEFLVSSKERATELSFGLSKLEAEKTAFITTAKEHEKQLQAREVEVEAQRRRNLDERGVLDRIVKRSIINKYKN